VKADETANVGTIRLQAGASLVGYVDPPRGLSASKVSEAVVMLTPKAAGTATHSLTTKPNARGFFHFDGVTPGEHILVGRLAKFASFPETLRIIDGTEAELNNHLLLRPLSTLLVSIAPPLDPTGHRWILQLDAITDEGRRRATVSASSSDDKGEWSAANILAGPYSVAVKDSRGSEWLRRDTEIKDDDLQLPLLIDVVPVAGSVRYGDKPIAATVTFSTTTVPAVSFDSDEDGSFHGHMPAHAADEWHVTIKAPALFLSRDLDKVHLTMHDGEARVALQIAASHLYGRVVTQDGQPAGKGIVTITTTATDQPFSQADVQPTGEFIVNGLPGGTYRARCDTYDAQESETVAFQIVDGTDPQPMTLVVRQQTDIQGLLFGDSGPVPGARVWAIPTDADRLFYFPRRTDDNGRFTFRLPPGSHECDFYVDAPGFASRIFHRRVVGDKMAIRVDQLAGQLHVKLPSNIADPGGPQLYLIHEGAAVFAFLAHRPAGADALFTLEPGQWSLCAGSSGDEPAMRAGAHAANRCASITVAPFSNSRIDASSLR
jgi:hypothetical protein